MGLKRESRSRSWAGGVLGAWLLLGAMAPAGAQTLEQLPLVPWPNQIEMCSEGVDLAAGTPLVAPSDARGKEIAGFLRKAVAEEHGLRLAAAKPSGDSGRPRVELRRDPAIKGEEAYRLSVGKDGVLVSARGDAGLMWGVQTLRQLLPAGGKGSVRVPCVQIDDAPSLAYRGQMLDVARHFYPVDFIKRHIDALSYYKINTFHWHLTDDQGWRIEIKRYPKLTKVGGWRTEPDGRRHGGFYTQRQVRDVVEYARQRGITVIPEIEMPGHATAALVAYPELGCVPPAPAVPNYWGVHQEIFCAGKEEVFTFLENVLDEVITLFPAPYLHIGGDEVPKQRWQACAACQDVMRREGLKDEHELQSWFVRRIQTYLHGKERTLIGWDEILEGGADRDAVIQVWRGAEEGHKALANGNRIITAGDYYIDTPADRLGLRELYSRKPLADATYQANAAQVWGAEAPLWSERVTPFNGEAMLYPRVLALSDITWNTTRRDPEQFIRRLPGHYRWMEAKGIAYGPEEKAIATYAVAYDRAARHWVLTANHGFDDMRSHYRLDGRDPGRKDPEFAQEVAITEPGTLRVAPFRGERQRLAPEAFTLLSHLALGAETASRDAPREPYSDTVLVDGVLGGYGFGDGTWVGWKGQDVQVTLDLGEVRDIRRIEMGFLQDSGSWIVLPRDVRYEVSVDGEQWQAVHQTAVESDAGNMMRRVERVDWRTTQPQRARWVRVTAVHYGKLPATHSGAGKDSWIFADELRVQ